MLWWGRGSGFWQNLWDSGVHSVPYKLPFLPLLFLLSFPLFRFSSWSETPLSSPAPGLDGMTKLLGSCLRLFSLPTVVGNRQLPGVTSSGPIPMSLSHRCTVSFGKHEDVYKLFVGTEYLDL